MNGAISWFARNSVAANLLMLVIAALGIYSVSNRIALEVFPDVQTMTVEVRVVLRGATPKDIEESITIRIEEAIQDLEGIEKIISLSREGVAEIGIEIDSNYDERILLEDIKVRIDALNVLPVEAENPIIQMRNRQREVISIAVVGDLTELELRQIAELTRDELLRLEGITNVSLDAARPYEISIEVPEPILREYQLTLAEIAAAVRASSLDLSAGSIKAKSGEVLIRSRGQAYTDRDFGKIAIRTLPDGTRLKLEDIASIQDGFEEEHIETRFNGQNAMLIEVYRVGDQSAIDVADTVRNYIEQSNKTLPEGIYLTYWRDRSKVVKQRLNTLVNSAIQGGLLVLLLLTLFLRPAVAFWVCIGIPISFMGGFLLMPFLGVTLNVISLFAFILVLGIVVDDAIVTGENIYKKRSLISDPLQASIKGTQEVAVPVTFGILTTITAFVPLLFIEGTRGQIFANIPAIVIPVLLFSLVESKLILPAHLKDLKISQHPTNNKLLTFQNRFADNFEQAILKYYQPSLRFCLNNRFLIASLFLATIIVVLSFVFSGWIKFTFFPRIQSEVVRATLTMPAGTPFEVTQKHIQHIEKAALNIKQKYSTNPLAEKQPESVDAAPNVTGLVSNILTTTGSAGGSGGGSPNRGRVMLELVSPEIRSVDMHSTQVAREWRQAIGDIPGAESLIFRSEFGHAGDPIDVQISGNNLQLLEQLAQKVKLKLKQYPNVFDISDSLSEGKEEFQLFIKPEAETLGITLSDVARQVRQAFFGFEVQRIQRGRDEVRVMVRYPAEQRKSLQTLNDMIIRSADGVEIPFSEVVELVPGRSPTVIKRIDRNQIINITADVNKEKANMEAIKRGLNDHLTEITAPYSNIHFSLEGEAKEQQESLSSLLIGALFVLFIIYCLLAIPFKSYIQPFIVMSAIPFGIVGSVVGHWIMSMNLSFMSVMGMLALIGVVVNDSLVLVDYINKRRLEESSLIEAVTSAGVARFRPVLLTSLTTFAGLTPLLLDKSTQAQFLIPMAISLGFGILFATVITLILVPVIYFSVEQAKWNLKQALEIIPVPGGEKSNPNL